jgi:hypothetical protein
MRALEECNEYGGCKRKAKEGRRIEMGEGARRTFGNKKGKRAKYAYINWTNVYISH